MESTGFTYDTQEALKRMSRRREEIEEIKKKNGLETSYVDEAEVSPAKYQPVSFSLKMLEKESSK